MRGMDELDIKNANLCDVICPNPMQKHVIEHLVLVELFLDQSLSKSRGIDRQIELTQDIRQSSDMVLVSVRQDDCRQVIAIFFEEVEVGDRDAS